MAPNASAFLEQFNSESAWLSRQPGMTVWQRGCEDLVDEMHGWLVRDSSMVCEASISRGDPRWESYLTRIWRCWSYHWREAVSGGDGARVISGREIAEALRHGRSVANGGSLGGDPLHEVVWVEALLQGDNRAIGLFYDRFQTAAERWAREINRELSNDLAWWQDLVAKLIGAPGETGKLASFSGRSALEPWLKTTLQRELIRQSTRRAQENSRLQELGEAVRESSPETPAGDAMTVECSELLSRALKSILDMAPRNERITMRLMFVEGLGPQEIGKVLRIHKGNVTKTAQRFMHRVQNELGIASSGGGNGTEKYGPCVEHLFDSRESSSLGGLLSQVLSHLHGMESPR